MKKFKQIKESKKMDDYVRILKYLNFQKINIDNNILNEINEIDKSETKNPTSNNNITIEQFKNIKNQIEIFKNIDNSLYYILIIESLPKNNIINLSRFFIFNYIKHHNLYEKMKDTDKPVKKLFNYYPLECNIEDFIKNEKPKKLLLEILYNLHLKDYNIIYFFIHCLNIYFL